MSKRLLSHLAHVELFTPNLDASLKFFTEVLGLIESDRAGNSVYLRCWGEHYHHSVVLTRVGPARAGPCGVANQWTGRTCRGRISD